MRDYIFELLLSAVGRTMDSSSSKSWSTLSKVPPPLSEGTEACVATCKRKIREKTEKEISICSEWKEQSSFWSPSHFFVPPGPYLTFLLKWPIQNLTMDENRGKTRSLMTIGL